MIFIIFFFFVLSVFPDLLPMAPCKLPVLLLVALATAVAVLPYLPAEARYLPTRGNDDRLTRLKELLTDVSIVFFFFWIFHTITKI